MRREREREELVKDRRRLWSLSASLTIVSTALRCLISSNTKELIIHTMRAYSFFIPETVNWRSNVISVINCSAASGHLCDLFRLICSRRSSWQSQRDAKLFQTLSRMILLIFHQPFETYPDLYWWLKCTATIAKDLRRTFRVKAPCCRQFLTLWTLTQWLSLKGKFLLCVSLI